MGFDLGESTWAAEGMYGSGGDEKARQAAALNDMPFRQNDSAPRIASVLP
ncbi:hypothetical protein C357_23190 [Citreicella sp. 357]|nr:hypothetical protein C357_23190 [Citreicella sp. 357]